VRHRSIGGSREPSVEIDQAIERPEVETGERMLDQLDSHARPGGRERLKVVDHGVNAVRPFGREPVRDVDRRRGGVIDGLEQCLVVGGPVVGQVTGVEVLDEADSRKVVAASGEDGAFRPARDVPLHPMRLIVARCAVDYTGRLTTHLPEAVRLLMLKNDGGVSIWHDGGSSVKPQNCGG
jgi:hypothetical protein